MPNDLEKHIIEHNIIGVIPTLTTEERDALTPRNGIIVYNTTTDKFQGYAAGSWIDLH